MLLALALDPGKCTGYALAAQDTETFNVCYGEKYLDPEEFWRFLNHILPNGDESYVICESFEFRQGKQHAGIDLYPRELIGILKLHRHFKQDALYFQNPDIQGGKNVYFNDAKLKDLELYRKGVGHGRSAVKHLLWWFYFGPGFQFLSSPEQKAELVDEAWFRERYLGEDVNDGSYC